MPAIPAPDSASARQRDIIRFDHDSQNAMVGLETL
jgi:hypothetical protein